MGRLISYRDNDGVAVITSKSLGNITNGTSSSKRKLAVRNIGDIVLVDTQMQILQKGTSDGYLYAKIAADSVTLSAPWNFAAVLAPTGGSWPGTGLRFYRITATNATGETGPSQEISVNVDDVAKVVQLTWTQVPGATGYKIYRGNASQSYGSSALLTTIGSGATTNYNDTGTATTSGSVPTQNTTAGGSPDFGTPPGDGSFGQTPLTFGGVDLGREFFFWFKVDVPSGLTADANTRQFNLKLVET